MLPGSSERLTRVFVDSLELTQQSERQPLIYFLKVGESLPEKRAETLEAVASKNRPVQQITISTLPIPETGNPAAHSSRPRSGRVTKATYPGGVTTEQTWDSASRLKTRVHKTGSATQQSFAYTYDKNGNRKNETRNLGAGSVETINYSYDTDDRLTGISYSGGKSETYTLDANGNRKQIVRSGYPTDNGTTINTFDARGRIGQRQTPSETVNYTWDAAGRLTQVQRDGDTTTYIWNAEHQLIGIQRNGSNIATYRYTHGLRDQVQSGGETNRTVWNDGFAFLKQDGGGNTITRTEHAGLKALFLSGAGGNEVLLRDGLDSVTGSIVNGALQSNTDYSAWGEANQTGTTQSNHGYTGHLQDETGLIYARARYYDPNIGRFISRDPLEGILDSPITWNAYLYGNANPFRYTDPTGEAAFLTDAEEISKESASYWRERREAAIAEGATLSAFGTGFAEGLANIGYGASWLMNATSDLIIRNVNLAGAEEAAQAMAIKELAAANLMSNVSEIAEVVRQDPTGTAKRVGAGLSDFGHGVVTGDAQAWGTVGQMASACAITPMARTRGVAGPAKGTANVVVKTEAFIIKQADSLGMAGKSLLGTRSVEASSVRVTSWADAGITPDLNPGRWVMLGEATKTNFWRTGLPGPKGEFISEFPLIKFEKPKVPFSNSITGEVPASSVQWPSGVNKWRGLFGQRRLTGGVE